VCLGILSREACDINKTGPKGRSHVGARPFSLASPWYRAQSVRQMKRIPIDRATEAGAVAGQRWAKASRNRARLERLREWIGRPRVIDHVVRFAIYSCFLTDRFMVAASVKDCARQYCVSIFKAERLAEKYWGRFQGWPRRGAEQARFVGGFVRGAAELAKVGPL
jgi:hypothetical protein